VKASGQWVSLNFGKDGYRKEKILSQQVITIESIFNAILYITSLSACSRIITGKYFALQGWYIIYS
jgi:hypothetical protein